MKKIILFIALFILITNFLNMYTLFADRIGDMRDKIEEEKERQEEEEKEKEKEKEKKDDDDDSSSGGCLGIFGLFASDDDDDDRSRHDHDDDDDNDYWRSSDAGESNGCLVDWFGALRFASYPYDLQNAYNFVGWQSQSPDNDKFVYLQADVEGTYLFQDTYGINAKVSMNLSILRIHCFYQYMVDPGDYSNIFSGNAGITIPVADGMLHLFTGFYLSEMISEMTFSFGGEFTYFFPANLIFDLYSLNSFFGELGFHTFSCSLSYAVGNFSFGGGFNLNYYAGVTFMGPMLKITLWI